MNVYELFQQAWEAATKIEFNPEWKNGTDYLDYATDAEDLNLEAGQFVACIDDLNRRVLIKGCGKKANIVVFERHGHGLSDVLVNNQPYHRYLKSVGFTDYVGILDGRVDTHNMEIFLDMRENKFIISELGVDYLNKNTPKDTDTTVLEALIQRASTEGITEKELVTAGFTYNMLYMYDSKLVTL